MAYVPSATPSSMMRRGSSASWSNGIGSILGMATPSVSGIVPRELSVAVDVLLDCRIVSIDPVSSAPDRPRRGRHRRRRRHRPRHRPRRSRPSVRGGHLGAQPRDVGRRPPRRSAASASPPTSATSAEVDAALARTTVAELGPVSILVNNAGGVFSSPLLDTTENGWDALYRSNLKHVILCTQRVARVMVEHGIGGSIISVTSIEGVRAAPGYAAYAAAKAGVINYTKTAALELAPHGIRVNALAPDITLTEGHRGHAPREPKERFGLTVPMGRAGHVDEMAGAAVFLAASCPATSPARRSTSTAAPMPPAAGTTIPRTAPTSRTALGRRMVVIPMAISFSAGASDEPEYITTRFQRIVPGKPDPFPESRNRGRRDSLLGPPGILPGGRETEDPSRGQGATRAPRCGPSVSASNVSAPWAFVGRLRPDLIERETSMTES